MVERLGSPARSGDIISAQAALEAQFAAVLQGRAGAPSPQRVTARALRLLFSQLKLLKLDAANARLRMLSAAIAGGEALQYSSRRFMEKHGLAEGADGPAIAQKLPKTSAWVMAGAK